MSILYILPLASPLFHLPTTAPFLRGLTEPTVTTFKAWAGEGSGGERSARLKEAEDLAGAVPVPSAGEAGEAPCQRRVQGAQAACSTV